MNTEAEIYGYLEWAFHLEPLPATLLGITYLWNDKKPDEVFIQYYVTPQFSQEDFEAVSCLEAEFNAAFWSIIIHTDFKKVASSRKLIPLQKWVYLREDLKDKVQ